MINVLLPEPVLPIKAVTSPGFASKEISVNISSSAPGYRNETFSKRMVPCSFPSKDCTCSSSVIDRFVVKISLILMTRDV